MWPLEDNGSKRADSICDMSDMCVFLGEYHISYIVGIVLCTFWLTQKRALYVSLRIFKIRLAHMLHHNLRFLGTAAVVLLASREAHSDFFECC